MARKGQFQPGVDPNRNIRGRKPGTKNKNKILADRLQIYADKLGGGDMTQVLVEKLILQALSGCIQSQKMLIERLIPAIKPSTLPIQLPKLPVDLFKKSEQILELATTGEITVEIAKDLLSGISVLLRVQEQTDLEKRLKTLEGLQK